MARKATGERGLIRAARLSAFAPLSQLAKDDDVRVRTQACAGLCNLLLDFSPVKRSLLDSGLVSLLVQYAGDPNPELRLNATWALKNALYKAEPAVKDAILRELTLTSLQRCVFGRLLARPSAWCLSYTVRCVFCRTGDAQAAAGPGPARAAAGADPAAQRHGRQRPQGPRPHLYRFWPEPPAVAGGAAQWGQRRHGGRGAAAGTVVSLEAGRRVLTRPDAALWGGLLVAQTLYIAANLASGTEVHKRTLIHCTPLLLAVRKYLVRPAREPGVRMRWRVTHVRATQACCPRSIACQSHPQPSLRVAALWVIINLSWGSDRGTLHPPPYQAFVRWSNAVMGPACPFGAACGCADRMSTTQRINKLVHLGIHDIVSELVEDNDADVKSRAAVAMNNMASHRSPLEMLLDSPDIS